LRKHERKGVHKKDRLRRDKALITEPRLRCIYLRLCKEFGTGSWWPAETKDEVFISAILTQQTQWHNVQISMRNLKEAGFLSVKRLASADLDMIEQKIRPSGFYHQKAARLKGACTAIESNGGLDEVFSLSERRLYQLLISINGIGRETADSIILYGAGKPALVVDNYTWRIVSRLYGSKVRYDYSALKSELEEKTRRSVRLYRNMHAQFVELGKKYCTKNNPKCVECPISKMCDYQKNRR
jgi:endonuclease-3 related protein